MYVRENIKCERRVDLELDEIECIWIEIFPKNSKSYLIGQIYRHPNEGVSWNVKFETQIEKILQQQKEFYILGDFNRDLLNENIRKSWTEYLEQFGLSQLVNVPTRKTSHSETLIDHIYCNIESNVSNIHVPKLGLSDHFPIFLTRKFTSSPPKHCHHTITYRSFKNFCEEAFINDLQSIPWDDN